MKIAGGIPETLKRPLRDARNLLRHIPYKGSERHCPVCKRSSKRFGSAGVPLRDEVRCMYCGAVERHRLTWLYFERSTDLFDGRPKRVLHVAPEPVFETSLRRRLGGGYLTADLYNPAAMVRMDITDIQYPDETFDVIYCSHVLEHVPDDRRAMREFLRVLKPTGWAVLLVPVADADATFEDLSVTDPAQRLRLFGQEDHVRKYGRDFVDRLRKVGFTVKVVTAPDFLTAEEITRVGVAAAGAGEIYYCSRGPVSVVETRR